MGGVIYNTCFWIKRHMTRMKNLLLLLLFFGITSRFAFSGALGGKDDEDFFTGTKKTSLLPQKQGEAPKELPFITARSTSQYKYWDHGMHKGIGVSVDMRSFRRPKAPIGVQCFFFRRDVSILQVQVQESQKTSDTLFFEAENEESPDWLIRVVVQGTVVRIESNQQTLRAFAEKSPEVLDQAIKDAK